MTNDHPAGQSDLDAILSEQSDTERSSLEHAWDALEEYPEDPAYREVWQATVWNSVAARLDERDSHSSATANHKTMVLPRLVAAAVVVVILMGIAFVVRPVSYTALPGKLITVSLPDGSSVEMNSGSTLTYPRWFMTARNVSLEGEAFFDVVKHSDPFVVKTFNARVRVVGTQFNVRARHETAVSVVSGLVEVSPLTAESSVEIAAEEHAVVRGVDVRRTNRLDNESALAWRKRDFVFRDAGLQTVASEIERRFATKIHLPGSGLSSRRVTINLLQPLTVETVVRDLCEALKLRYRRTSDGFELFEERSS